MCADATVGGGKTQVLVLNAGSSSVKYAVFDVVEAGDPVAVVSGLVEKIGAPMGKIKHEPAGEEKVVIEMEFPDHKAGLQKVIELLTDPTSGKVKSTDDIKVVGHRVVHGGESFTSAALITDDVMAAIEKATALAPLHNPANITGINVAKELFTCPNVAVFDTAFHMTMPPSSYLYAVPYDLYTEESVRRYGFHGSSYTYVTDACCKYLNVAAENVNLIICHLGNGASAAAIKGGKCVDTTMGLTPLEGLVMGTRSGDVDPALHYHLEGARNMSSKEVNTLLNKKSGLLGLCGDSDMRAIQERMEAGDEKAKNAMGVFVHRVRKYLGSFLVALGGKVDAVVFTAGIGENSKFVRQLVCEGLEGLGIAVDAVKNGAADGISEIQPDGMPIKVMVVPTNEELSITLQAIQITSISEAPKPAAAAAETVAAEEADAVAPLASGGGGGPGAGLSSKKANLLRKTIMQMGGLGGNKRKTKWKRASVARIKQQPEGEGAQKSVMIANVNAGSISLITLGFMNRIMATGVKVGYFRPITGTLNEAGVDSQVELMKGVFGLTDSTDSMIGVSQEEALECLTSDRQDEMYDKIIGKFEAFRAGKQFIVIGGCALPAMSNETNVTIAHYLRAPMILANDHKPTTTATKLVSELKLAKLEMDEPDTEVKLAGVVVNRIPKDMYEAFSKEVQFQAKANDLPVACILPTDPSFSAFRIPELVKALGATVVAGEANLEMFEVGAFVTGTGTVEETIAALQTQKERPLLILDASRVDLLFAILFSSQSSNTTNIGGILLTEFTALPPTAKMVLNGLEAQTTPMLGVKEDMLSVLSTLKTLKPVVLPTSAAKIQAAENLFEDNVTDEFVRGLVSMEVKAVMTPKLFQYRIFKTARTDKQHIVLPEGEDKRVVAAAAELVKRNLAQITILGKPEDIRQTASKLQVDIGGCNLLDPTQSEDQEKYATMLFEARKAKGMTMEKAMSVVQDANFYGTMMMYAGVADGMVSGACHTTADTMRPALQVIKTAPGIKLVSSIFFMLLPEKVYVYGDCAINVDPDSDQLASIAVSSAITANGFGIDPKVAMLSYATGDSNKSDIITKVRDATSKAQGESVHPIEGPLQFDAAVDPEVAKVKVKTESAVAGQATVCIFPDLNTGNNAYKAVQQSTGCIAMGPIMQGLRKPVNDLSRGCTIDDIVNTVVITCVQAIDAKKA